MTVSFPLFRVHGFGEPLDRAQPPEHRAAADAVTAALTPNLQPTVAC
jgi:hypothetical protein